MKRKAFTREENDRFFAAIAAYNRSPEMERYRDHSSMYGAREPIDLQVVIREIRRQLFRLRSYKWFTKSEVG
jgi:hypothetical protein